jgi:peptidyl-prolyl cis-trans isomerase D
MAIIGKIRERSGLVIVVIMVALLAFLLSDAISSKYTFGGSSNDVGEIDGKDITYNEFDQKVKYNEGIYQMNQETQNIDENTRQMINDQTWNEMIQQLVIDKEFNKLGLEVTNREIQDFTLGERTHPQILKYFSDPATNTFNRSQLINYLKNKDRDETRKMAFQWANFEKGLVADRLNQKYTALVKNGLYVTSLEGKEKFLAKNKTADVKFVGLNYGTVPDSTIELSDSELKDYLKRNFEKYKAKEAGRGMEYVVFDIIPTTADSEATAQWGSEQRTLFTEATNDSLYVSVNNSETKFDTTYHHRGFIGQNPELDDSLFEGPVGTVVGPYFENGRYKLAKVLDVKNDTMVDLRASHILIKIKGPTKEDTLAAKNKANDLLAQIKRGASFEELARTNGEDASAAVGGDLGWFFETGKMIPDFADAVKKANKGSVFVLKTQFGFHVIKVTENPSNKMVKVAVLDKEIEAGKNTLDSTSKSAYAFASANRTDKEFQEAVVNQKLTKRTIKSVLESEKQVPGLDKPKPLLRWAFEEGRKKGDVSDPIELDDKYVVAVITSVTEKDEADLESVRTEVEAEARKEKKGEMLTEKIEAAMKEAKTPEELAIKLATVVQSSPTQNFDDANIPYIGMDYKILGTIFGTPENTFSKPVAGENGVYVVWVNKFNTPVLPKEYKALQAELLEPLKARADYESYNALKEIAKIEDRRFKVY